MKFWRSSLRGLVAALLVVQVLVALAHPASAHAGKVRARLLTVDVRCIPDLEPFCTAYGKVRIANNRARGTGKVPICVGVDVTARHGRSISIEPPDEFGQSSATLRPGRSTVRRYRTTFDSSAGRVDRVVVTHVHRFATWGGKEC